MKKVIKEVVDEFNVKAIETEKKDLEFLSQYMTIVETDKAKFAEVCQRAYPRFEDDWGKGVWEAIQEL